MTQKIQYERAGDNSFYQLINGQKVAIFKIKGWMNNLIEEPNRLAGAGHISKFAITQYIEHGRWE